MHVQHAFFFFERCTRNHCFARSCFKFLLCFSGLPHTKLGEVLENRVNEFLKKNNSGAGEVTIRVVSSVDKIAEIKPGMKTRYAVAY